MLTIEQENELFRLNLMTFEVKKLEPGRFCYYVVMRRNHPVHSWHAIYNGDVLSGRHNEFQKALDYAGRLHARGLKGRDGVFGIVGVEGDSISLVWTAEHGEIKAEGDLVGEYQDLGSW